MLKVTQFARFKRNEGDVNLIDVLQDIRSGKYATKVNQIRVYMDKGNPDAAETLKKELPAVTLSATYAGQRLAKCITAYNPLVILDFDELKKEDLARLLDTARQAVYTVACWISPRGHGIKIIAYPAVRMERSLKNHKAVYTLVKDWYENLLGIGADASGSDIGRLCLLSYDPTLYISPCFEPWLKGESGEPEGIGLIEPPVDPKAARLLASARKKTTRKYAYDKGNRNNYVHLFASHCNRLGINQADVVNYAAKAFADLPADERAAVIDSAYAHDEQHATAFLQTGRRGASYVVQIQEHLSAHYDLRRNVVRRLVECRPKGTDESFMPVNDYWENSVWCALQKEGVLCSVSELRSVIHSDFSPEYDPFCSYFDQLPAWDRQTDPIGALAATVNDSEVLTDRTGSRRFLCFEATRIDYTLPVDHTAVYAQALALFREGFCFWFANADIAEINSNNEPFQLVSPELELLYTYYRKPVRFEMPLLLSCSERVTRIAERTRFPVTASGINIMGKMLKREGFEWVKKHGKQLYRVIELTSEQVEARRKGFGYDPSENPEDTDKEKDIGDDQTDPKLPF